MPAPDMQKFLYTILKQVDLKSVLWNEIAEETGITNGHAARMRYSRFKKQMEGHIPQRRARAPGSTPKKERAIKKPKQDDDKAALMAKLKQAGDVKGTISPKTIQTSIEGTASMSAKVPTPPSTPADIQVKSEPREGSYVAQIPLPEFDQDQVYGIDSPLKRMSVVSPGQQTHSELPLYDQSFDFNAPMFNMLYMPSPSDNSMSNLMDFRFSPSMTPPPAQMSFDSPSNIYGTRRTEGQPIVVKTEDTWATAFLPSGV